MINLQLEKCIYNTDEIVKLLQRKLSEKGSTCIARLPGCNMEWSLIPNSQAKPMAHQDNHHRQSPGYKGYHYQHRGDDTVWYKVKKQN